MGSQGVRYNLATFTFFHFHNVMFAFDHVPLFWFVFLFFLLVEMSSTRWERSDEKELPFPAAASNEETSTVCSMFSESLGHPKDVTF